MGVRLALAVLALFSGAASAAPAPRAAAQVPYLFAVLPQGPPMLTSARWSPVVDRIGRDAGVALQLKLYERAEELFTDLTSGAVEFAYVNPPQAVHAFRSARYRPLVRDAKPIRGVVFVARESPVASLEALAGAEITYPGPAVALALRPHVQGLGIAERFAGTRANVYRQVILGRAAAGSTLDDALAQAPPEVRERLRVVFTTPPMAPHPVVVHPRVPRAAAARVAAAFLALASTQEGAELLGAVHLEAPVPADYTRDYAPLERHLGTSTAAALVGEGE
jgi:phosphonate transport system substrate-binding protein